ncbi:hypothetical protein DCC81_02650 [Chitinophaga parva]|uniref:Uncharacterized protein n=1 Tax=Chitinophaga parva TaxID=2169414 RepID=A0A2T7BL64_9BACT|nr:hypothetical protein DCC81_02650 [Chitinophaga parva]
MALRTDLIISPNFKDHPSAGIVYSKHLKVAKTAGKQAFITCHRIFIILLPFYAQFLDCHHSSGIKYVIKKETKFL